MSTTADAVFDHSPYAAPEADLQVAGGAHADRVFSYKNRIGVMRFNAHIMIAIMAIFGGIAMFGVLSQFESGIAIAAAFIPGVFLIAYGIRLFVYSAIKRLHDLNYSGWYFLISMIPVVGLIWFFYFSLKPAPADENRFGPTTESTMIDKVLGTFGIIFIVASTLASIIPSV